MSVVRFESRFNSAFSLRFLQALRAKQPQVKIYLICDNAGYYRAKVVQLYAKAHAIKLIYLPPYSPNLNIIERLWKFFVSSQ